MSGAQVGIEVYEIENIISKEGYAAAPACGYCGVGRWICRDFCSCGVSTYVFNMNFQDEER